MKPASQLSAAVVERCVAEIPFYAHLPGEVLDGEVTASVAENFRLLARPGLPGTDDLTRIIAWSARRAEEQVPLEAVLSAYLVGAEVWWRALAEADEDTVEAGVHLLGYLREVLPAVAMAHLQEAEHLRGDDRRVRGALVAALLAGQPFEALAEAARVPIASSYTVLTMSFASPSVRLVQSALNAQLKERVLTELDRAGGLALLPAGEDTPDLPALVARVAEVTGRPVTAAASTAVATANVPAAAEEAREVLEIVQRLGRPPGLYRFDDVLLEYQLARPGQGLLRLAAKLDRLDGHRYLLDTLRAFVVRGHNRSQSAQDLHIHRNTLDYRLHRIATLTGLDPADPHDARLLGAALTARDLR